MYTHTYSQTQNHPAVSVEDAVNLVQAQLLLTNERVSAAKNFERIMLQYVNIGTRRLLSRELQPAIRGGPTSNNAITADYKTVELPHTRSGSLDQQVTTPSLQYVNSLLHYDVTDSCFYASTDTSEKGIDAVYICEDEIWLIQVR